VPVQLLVGPYTVEVLLHEAGPVGVHAVRGMVCLHIADRQRQAATERRDAALDESNDRFEPPGLVAVCEAGDDDMRSGTAAVEGEGVGNAGVAATVGLEIAARDLRVETLGLDRGRHAFRLGLQIGDGTGGSAELPLCARHVPTSPAIGLKPAGQARPAFPRPY